MCAYVQENHALVMSVSIMCILCVYVCDQKYVVICCNMLHNYKEQKLKSLNHTRPPIHHKHIHMRLTTVITPYKSSINKR